MAEAMPDQFLPVEVFKVRAKSLIPSDWLSFINSDETLSWGLDDLLSRQHEQFQPRRDGEWSAEPPWKDMFAWMTCPIDEIRAIFIDMKPLRPASYSYRSIGCGLGVQLRPGVSPDIMKLDTIWNFIRLTHEVMGAEWTEQVRLTMANKFRNGFNPLYLSQNNNILFLQLQCAIGEENLSEDDTYTWAHIFTVPLLRTLATWRPPLRSLVKRENQFWSNGHEVLPVIQLYNRKWLEEFFQSYGFEQHFDVFLPSFMSTPEPEVYHIVCFNEQFIRQYAAEVNTDGYKNHRQIFGEIYDAICNNTERLTFSEEQLRRSVKIESLKENQVELFEDAE